MILAKKVRLKPTKKQEVLFWQASGIARYVFNYTIAVQKTNYRLGGKFLNDKVIRKHITKIKKREKYAWLGNVSNDVAKQAVKDACNAYKNFFRCKKGFPKFKSKRKSTPSFYNDVCKLKVGKKQVNLAKIGWVKTREQLPNENEFANPRITFDGKFWFLSVGVDTQTEQENLTNVSLGIDVGIKSLAVCSNGKEYKNINKTKPVKKLEKRLKRLQRQVSRKYEMNKQGNKFVKTSNIISLEQKIRMVHRDLHGIRNNHLHQTTTEIVRTKPSRIVMETLNISGMMKNKHLAKAVQNQCLNEFKRQIEYKCKKNGIEFVQADTWYPSSKKCSVCGNIKKDLKLSDRTYRCECGLLLDRDLNASINLSNYTVS